MWHWSVSAKIYYLFLSLSVQASRVPAVAYTSNLWIPPHVCTLFSSSPFTGDNNTVVYLEEVPLQAFPMFQGITKHIAKFKVLYLWTSVEGGAYMPKSDEKMGRPSLALICHMNVIRWEGPNHKLHTC